VTREAVKVLKAVGAKHSFGLDFAEYDLGAQRYLRTGEILPATVLQELRGFDAILLGAIGHPDITPGLLEKESSCRCASIWISTSICAR